MKSMLLIGSLVAASALSGCIDQQSFATTPVQVETEKGTVICQLYTLDQVLWDEAIAVPAGMSIQEGNRVCISEGNRRLTAR